MFDFQWFSSEISNIWLLVLSVVGFVFAPAVIAFLLNRKQWKLILIGCVPASVSFASWGLLMLWALTGKQKNSEETGRK